MNLDELLTLSEEELRRRANVCLTNFETESDVDRERHVSEAQFYLAEIKRRDQSEERREDRRIARRDRWIEIGLELVIIALIGFELREGGKQMQLLDNLNASSAATSNTIREVESTLQPQIDVLLKTQRTLDQQLSFSRQQQGLISRQLALQETAVAEQERKPIVEFRAFSQSRSGKKFIRILPNDEQVVGYSSTPSGQGANRVYLEFLIRNVGTKAIINLSAIPRVPQSIKVECVGYSGLVVIGQLHGECTAPVGPVPPIEPVRKNTPPPSEEGFPDFTVAVVLNVPEDLTQFGIIIELLGENLPAAYYRVRGQPYQQTE